MSGTRDIGQECWGICAMTPDRRTQISVELNPLVFQRDAEPLMVARVVVAAAHAAVLQASDRGRLDIGLSESSIAGLRARVGLLPEIFVDPDAWEVAEVPGEVMLATRDFRISVVTDERDKAGKTLLHGPWMLGFAFACGSHHEADARSGGFAQWADFAGGRARVRFSIALERLEVPRG